jgi:hypothetical protein
MEVSGQLHTPAALPTREIASDTRWTGGWLGSRAGPGAMENRQILPLPGIERRCNNILKSTIIWDVIPCSLVEVYRCCRRTHRPHPPGAEKYAWQVIIASLPPILIEKTCQTHCGFLWKNVVQLPCATYALVACSFLCTVIVIWIVEPSEGSPLNVHWLSGVVSYTQWCSASRTRNSRALHCSERLSDKSNV